MKKCSIICLNKRARIAAFFAVVAVFPAYYFPAPAFSAEREALIRTFDGISYAGEIMNPGSMLEWRRDIYETGTGDGQTEKFILKPENRGSTRLSDIREIRSIRGENAPAQFATLENNVKAKQVLKYVIVLNSGRAIYISDFITMDNFYVDIRIRDAVKRTYLSRIAQLKFSGAREIKSAGKSEIKTVGKPAAVMPAQKPEGKKTVHRVNYTVVIIVLIIILLMLLAVIIAMAAGSRHAVIKRQRRRRKRS